MLTDELRPVRLDDVCGLRNVKLLLKAIIKEPDVTPNTLLFRGTYGTGKTTCARILYRELNKSARNVKDLTGFKTYKELNMAEYKAEDISVITNDTEEYMIVVLEGLQTLQAQEQSVLLKVLEEPHRHVKFIIMAAENENRILPAIISRSLVFDFRKISYEDIKGYIAQKTVELNLEQDEKVIEAITLKSYGHMRNAVMLLDAYRHLGKDFLSIYQSPYTFYKIFYKAVITKNKEEAINSINNLSKFPLAELVEGFNTFLKTLARQPKTDIRFLQLGLSDFLINAQDDDIRFQTALLLIYELYNRR